MADLWRARVEFLMTDEIVSTEGADRAISELVAFPVGLLDWAGHRRGGVRRMFTPDEGRPSGRLIQTPLLVRLRKWASDVAAGLPGVPRIVLLVGGPGNGKTEAVEDAIRELETSLAIDGKISASLVPFFNPTDGSTVPRRVRVNIADLGVPRPLSLTLIPDASVGEAGGLSAARCLVSDLEAAMIEGTGALYLACVNRGILDDALIAAVSLKGPAQQLISTIVAALAASVEAPSCWPLIDHPAVAVWPMDIESLLLPADPESGDETPASQALGIALDESRWPGFGNCPAGKRCPFCNSRHLLARQPHQESFLRIMRGYELATGKRWSFRDLLSLFSYLLAGSPPAGEDGSISPCQWASNLSEGVGRSSTRGQVAPFLLVAAQYQHALFGGWPHLGRRGLRRELSELGVEKDTTLLGLSAFLASAQSLSVPRTLRTELTALGIALDPANASPDLQIGVSGQTTVRLRDIDARFSHSVREGLEMIRKYQFLSHNELDLLRRLADADDRLGTPEVRNRKPTVAAALQVLLRDFSCRLVRRTLGVRSAVVRDYENVEGFAKLVGNDERLASEAAKRVEGLLNENGRFTITLNNTFGEPPPPDTRRVVLETDKQKVRPAKSATLGRPRSDLRFLAVGSQASTQHIPLTYELFRAVRELQDGMLAASLPRTVVASLDTARARLAGRVVRNADALDDAEMRIGIRSERIGIEGERFVVRTEEES